MKIDNPYDTLINRISLRLNIPFNIVKAAVNSEFEFIRDKIQKVDLNKINEKEDLYEELTSFFLMGLGNFYLDIYKLKSIKKRKRKDETKDTR